MKAFIAKGLNEKWVITRNAHVLDKLVTKTTKQAVIRKHITTTYLTGGKALPAFRAEKKKALARGLEISNFDSTVKRPEEKEYKVKITHPQKAKVFGQYVQLES
jgi:hypothetical protein